MKLTRIIFILLMFSTVSGCLTYKTYEVTAVFNDNFSRAEITATYTDVRSSEKDSTKQREDFKSLIEEYQGDEFLLEQVKGGIYVKERKIYEKDGMLNAGFSGVFERIGSDGRILKVNGDERYILLEDIEPNDIIVSNGKVLRSKKVALLVWPKDLKKISYKVTKVYDQPTYSLLDLYQNWIKQQ